MKFYLFILFFISVNFVCGNDYMFEDISVPLKSLYEINAKYLRTVSVPEAGVSHLSPYRHLTISHDQKLNSSHFNYLLREGFSIFSKTEDKSSKCIHDLLQIIWNIKSLWALKMLDSSGKLASGLLLGSNSWPGSYRECKSIASPLDKKYNNAFHGKYCEVSWLLTIPKFPEMNITSGICIPDSCGSDDMEDVIHFIMHYTGQIPIIKKLNSVLSLNFVTCESHPNPPDAGTIIYVIILCVLLFFVVLGSSLTAIRYFSNLSISRQYSIRLLHQQYDNRETYGSIQTSEKSEQSVLEEKCLSDKQIEASGDHFVKEPPAAQSETPEPKKSGLKGFFSCFSLFDNAAKVLEIKQNSSQLQTIHGIRFLSLTWVILGHTYITAAPYISNKSEVLKDVDTFSFQMVLKAPFSVDSFFVLSGLLLSYLFLKEADKKNGKINWLYFYFHRFWRLTPVYLLVVGFYMLVFRYLGSGPFWNSQLGDSERHTWWYYVLYINNFIPIKQMCLGWSWYLANDMQFYVISPLFLYPLWRWPKIGISIAVSLIFSSWITIAVLSYQDDIKPLLSGIDKVTDLNAYQNAMWHSFDVIYDKPYCRIGPYLIGVLCGYLLFKAGNNKRFFRPWHQIYGWGVAVFYSAIVVFGLYHAEITRENSAAYNALSRTAFSIGLAWLIFACETGHGGLITKLLSMKFWIPLSRLTYCAYLVHPILIHKYYLGLKAVMYFTHITMVTLFFGFLVMSYAIAFVVSICFESPMMNIEKLLLKR